MKYLFYCLILAGILITSGCATANRNTYRATSTAAISVDTAMKIYADLVVAGKVSVENQDKVKKAYSTYQRSMLLVQDVVNSKVLIDDATWTSAMTSALSAAKNLVALIQGL